MILNKLNTHKVAPKRSWGLGIFGLCFAAPAVCIFLFSVVPTFWDYFRMQTWQATEAYLTQASLVQKSDSDNGTTYKATATYTYIIEGRSYTGSKVAIDNWSDNIGRFQQNLGYQLESDFASCRPIQIWVNPSDFNESVIDRSLRIALLLFKLMFVLIFGGVGLGLMYFGLRKNSQIINHPEVTEKPWLALPKWNHHKIKSNQNIALWVMLGCCVFWNLISSFVWFSVVEKIQHKEFGIALICFIFPAIGLGFIWKTFQMWQDWKRFGDLVFEMDPFPGAIGGQVGGRCEINYPFNPTQKFLVNLQCLYTYETKSSSETETRHNSIWQADGIAATEQIGSRTRISLCINVPAGLPESDIADKDYHEWILTLKSNGQGIKFERKFTLPVFATGEKAVQVLPDAVHNTEMDAVRESTLESLARITQVNKGLDIYFPMFRNIATYLGGLVFGFVFAFAGYFAGQKGAPFLFPLVFCAVGSLIMLACVYGALNSLKVEIREEGIRTQRFILGILVWERRALRRDFVRFVAEKSSTTWKGSQPTEYYKVKALLKNGKKITLLESIPGAATADYAIESIKALTVY